MSAPEHFRPSGEAHGDAHHDWKAAADKTSADLRARLTRFFTQYNPAMVRDVDKLLDEYAGREEDLFTALTTKYGAEPAMSNAPGDDQVKGTGIPKPTAKHGPNYYYFCIPDHSGVLQKEGGKVFKSNQTRYFEIYGCSLVWYKSRPTPGEKPLGCIDLKNTRCVENPKDTKGWSITGPNMKKTYVLHALNDAEKKIGWKSSK